MDIVFALYPNFTALDAIGPYEVLCRIPGANVVFGAIEPGELRTDTGIVGLTADVALGDVDRADVVVVPGGPGTRAIMNDSALIDWVKRVHPTTQWTTSVCTGSLVLGGAGLLEGKRATTHWAADQLLESFGATYTPERVVTEGKIVTAAGVSSGIDMAIELVSRIAGDDVAKAIQLSIEYDPQPPFDSGSVAKSDPAIVDLVRELVLSSAG
jgi:transcriptional regulator GlxA family with amidase domain